MPPFFDPSTRSRLCRLLARSFVATLAVGLTAGCTAIATSRWTNVFLPYKVEVVQGNVVTSDQVARVVLGMNRVQVRDILGSPLLTDMFHADRWDYVFMLTRAGAPLQKRTVVVIFESDKLVRIDAPDLPSDAEFIDAINPFRERRDVPVLALTEEQIRALPVPPRPAPAASAVEGPVRTYPPLEPRG
jgi:outer membrane protein assembly factor BamE